ncbi:TPR domain containing protein [Pyrenophora tritici-repentis]|nr:TPR domain containing protein [Pyrenophora tritici-repentis]KAI1555480.1 TPR domain containing protein [Pyrenophora tritici-repentis]KAI1588534.1 TPR domain containing protein [Pyrenophora tritici-repentis]KAI1607152.1 TPR domain containing protein [Pyrenophora tritici-repentis]
MAYWGLAFVLGPNYNKPWDLFDEKELKATLGRINNANIKAKQYASKATELERALIDAIQVRVPKDLNEAAFVACNREYAEAMKVVHERFSDDLDIASLYADSLVCLSAWDLWDLKTGEPTPGARSLEAKAVLEKALQDSRSHEHPGIPHLYIHLMEMSKTPEAALVCADRLRKLNPDAGHLVHMPSHLDILVGDYRRAIDSNADACLADEKYVAEHGSTSFYMFYMMHNYHSLIYAAMFAGQSKVALDTVERMEASLPVSLLRVESPPMADWLENFASVRIHVLVRFGRWDDLIQLEMPHDKELHCVTTAMIHYGKGVAYAATGKIENAEKERADLGAAVERIPASRICGDFPNRASVVLQVGIAMLDGELEYRKGNYELAFKHLETAIELDDKLTYAEPWPWMQPTRHAYAALLMEQGRIEEAGAAYKADLGFDDSLPRARQHPNNVWALHG